MVATMNVMKNVRPSHKKKIMAYNCKAQEIEKSTKYPAIQARMGAYRPKASMNSFMGPMVYDYERKDCKETDSVFLGKKNKKSQDRR